MFRHIERWSRALGGNYRKWTLVQLHVVGSGRRGQRLPSTAGRRVRDAEKRGRRSSLSILLDFGNGAGLEDGGIARRRSSRILLLLRRWCRSVRRGGPQASRRSRSAREAVERRVIKLSDRGRAVRMLAEITMPSLMAFRGPGVASQARRPVVAGL